MSGLAKAIITMMLSHKDGWEMTMGKLQAIFSDGSKAIRNAIRELEALGYAVREQVYDHKRKKPAGVLWRWYSHPSLSVNRREEKKLRKSVCTKVDLHSSAFAPECVYTGVHDIRMTISKEELSKKEDLVMKEEGKRRASLSDRNGFTMEALSKLPAKEWS